MIQQTISAPRWKQTFFLIFLTCFKIGTCTYDSRLSKSSLPWRNLVGSYAIFGCARTDYPADDFRSKMIKIDLLAHLLDLLLHRDLEVQGLYLKVIIALAKFGTLIYHFFCARTDDPVDDFRSKMIETDLLTHLLDLLQHRDLEVQGLSIKIIIALAKFGRLM